MSATIQTIRRTLTDSIEGRKRLRYFYNQICFLFEEKYEDKKITAACIGKIKEKLPHYEGVYMQFRKQDFLTNHLVLVDMKTPGLQPNWDFTISLNNQQKFSIKRFMSHNTWAGEHNDDEIRNAYHYLENDTALEKLLASYKTLQDAFANFLVRYDDVKEVRYALPDKIGEPMYAFTRLRYDIFGQGMHDAVLATVRIQMEQENEA